MGSASLLDSAQTNRLVMNSTFKIEYNMPSESGFKTLIASRLETIVLNN